MAETVFEHDDYFKIDPEAHFVGDMKPFEHFPGVQMWWRAIHNIARPLMMGAPPGALEGISPEDFVTWQKAVLLDMVYLQQDAFDDVDASMPRERQVESFELVKELIDAEYDFRDRDVAREFFTRITGLYKNWNYSAPDSPDYGRYLEEIRALLEQHRKGAPATP